LKNDPKTFFGYIGYFESLANKWREDPLEILTPFADAALIQVSEQALAAGARNSAAAA
jgi:hypothetical protein